MELQSQGNGFSEQAYVTNVDASVGWNLRERALAAYLLVCYNHGGSVESMMPPSVFTVTTVGVWCACIPSYLL